MFEQIKENKLVLAGIGLAIALTLFLIVDSIASAKGELSLKVASLEKQVAEVSNLATQIKAQGGNLNVVQNGGKIKALLPWLEKRFNITKMTDNVENMALNPKTDQDFAEIVNFRLVNISMADLLPLLQQFDQIDELKLIKGNLSRAKTQGIVFEAELGLRQ